MFKFNKVSRSLLIVFFILMAKGADASTLFIGFDTQAPVKLYTTGGAFISNFGQTGATGSALDGAGHVWTVAPAFGNNTIKMYDAAQTELNSFTAAVNGNWIEDMAWGGSNSIWVGTYEGNVFNINATTGTINSSFAVANSSFTGVAFDGTNLWLTGGFASNNLYKYDTSGNLLQTIALGNFGLGGLGYDLTDNTLWGGSTTNFGTVYHLALDGTVLGSFDTGSNAFHDGLEVGDINRNTVPEPATLLLLGAGLAALARRSRRT